jgi:hypothetical protein
VNVRPFYDPLSVTDGGKSCSAIVHGYHGIDRVLGTTAGKVANLACRPRQLLRRSTIFTPWEAAR